MAKEDAQPTVYNPEHLIVMINGEFFPNINSVDATPIDTPELESVRSTTGHRGWTKNPEYGVEITIEFSGNMPANKRNSLRQMKGQAVEISVTDKSGTKDGVTGHNARLINQPDFSRDDSEATIEGVWQAPTAEWGSQ